MKTWLAKVGKGWLPADDAARDLLNQMNAGECAHFEIVRPRSVQWNRLYWSLCRTIGENQDPPRDEDSIDSELRIRAGHFDVLLIDGHEVRIPKRIAFAKLTADEWADYFQKVEQAIATRFGPEYLAESAA